MFPDSRTMTDVFGPTKVLVGSRDDPACCAATAALLISRCEQERPQPWLACACATIASLLPEDVAVSAMLGEPTPDVWKTSAAGVGGRFGRKLLDAMLEELLAGLPSDDIAARLGHREMWPQTICARREDLIAGEAWATCRYRARRRRLGLGEFVRVVTSLEDHLSRPRTFVVQFDGVGDAWTPDERFVRTAGVCAACVWAAFREKFVSPLERSEQTLALLSPTRRKIARLIVAGKTETQIGAMLGRSRHTVRDHVKGMYQTFEVSTRVDLIARLSGARRSTLTPTLPESAFATEDAGDPGTPELKPTPVRTRPRRRGAAKKPMDPAPQAEPTE